MIYIFNNHFKVLLHVFSICTRGMSVFSPQYQFPHIFEKKNRGLNIFTKWNSHNNWFLTCFIPVGFPITKLLDQLDHLKSQAQTTQDKLRSMQDSDPKSSAVLDLLLEQLDNLKAKAVMAQERTIRSKGSYSIYLSNLIFWVLWNCKLCFLGFVAETQTYLCIDTIWHLLGFFVSLLVMIQKRTLRNIFFHSFWTVHLNSMCGTPTHVFLRFYFLF